MTQIRIRLLVPVVFLLALTVPGQAQRPVPPAPVAATAVQVAPPDAQRTRGELWQLMQRYPPGLRNTLALDPSLLGNQSYLAPYPLLVQFLNEHPEITHDPSFYLGDPVRPRDSEMIVAEAWRDDIQGMEFVLGFGVAAVLIGFLIRSLMDYRRWSQQNKVQTEVHMKLLDRLAGNEELLAYIQSPAGSKFLESSPITIDAAPRNFGAPIGRILWTIQAGVVLIAGGAGLLFVSARTSSEASMPLHALGVLGVALGVGFVISAIISFMISRHLGLIQPGVAETPKALQ